MRLWWYDFCYSLTLLLTLVAVLLSVAFFTLVDRKLMGGMQRRIGPNVTGPFGLFQPFMDGLKLSVHTFPVLQNTQVVAFAVAPLISFLVTVGGFLALPDATAVAFNDSLYSLLYLAGFSGYSLFGTIVAGWSSGSRYAFLGGLRSTAQMLAYEVLLTMLLATAGVISGSLSLEGIVLFQFDANLVSLCPVAAFSFLWVMLAETNRTPFDLMEAEAEIVAGFNVEYSALIFSMFFLGEYAAMLFLSCLFVSVFLGGSVLWGWSCGVIFISKVFFVVYFFGISRAALPRLRYDQVLAASWRYGVPFLFVYLLFCGLLTNAT